MSIIIEDQSAGLTLLHYDGTVTDETDNHIKDTRGTITDSTFEPIVSTFGYTPEYTVDDHDKYVPLLDKLEDCTMFRAEEGTFLRLFCHDHKWHLSTFKRLNAFESRWSSEKTFGEWFVEALRYFYTDGAGKNQLQFEEEHLYDVFCNTLDRELVYTFLLRTNEDTKIVCRTPEHPTVFFTGVFRNGKRLSENPLLLSFPEQVTFSTVQDLEQYVMLTDPFEHQGVLIILPDQRTIKISNTKHFTYKSIRGSEPDIEMAYFRVRNSSEEVKVFTTMFPRVDTTRIESSVTTMMTYLHRMYVRRFIKKLYTMLHPTLFHVLRKAHTWHTENRPTNIVTFDKMKELIEGQDSVSLFRMYKEYTSHETKKANGTK